MPGGRRFAIALAIALPLAAGCSSGGGGGKHDADANADADGRDASTIETFIETAPPPSDDADAPDANDAINDLTPGDAADADGSPVDVGSVDADASPDADGGAGLDGGDAADGLPKDGAPDVEVSPTPTLCDMALSTLAVPSGPVKAVLLGDSRNNYVSCGGFLATPGPEAVYTLKIDEAMTVEVRVDSDETVAIAIRGGCGDGVSELACAQSGNVATSPLPPPVPVFDGGFFDGATASSDAATPATEAGSSDGATSSDAADGAVAVPEYPLTGVVRARLNPGKYTVIVDQRFTFAPTGRYAISVRKMVPAANASCQAPTVLPGAATILDQDLDFAAAPAIGCGTSPGSALYYAVGVASGQRLTVRATPKFGDRSWMPRMQAFMTCAASTCLAQGRSASGTTQQLDWVNNGDSWRVVLIAVSADSSVSGARFDLSVGLADSLATCGRPTMVVDGSAILNQDAKQALPPDGSTCSGTQDHALYYAAQLLPQQTITATIVGSLTQSMFNVPALIAIRSGCDIQDCTGSTTMTSFTNSSTETKTVLIEAIPVPFSSEPTFDLHVSIPPPPASIFVLGADALVTTETGGKATFQIKLGSPPTASVTVPLSSDTPTEGTVSPSSLVFTTANWSVAQTVTVTGVDDSASDGARGYQIVTGAATSADATYSGLDASDVPVTNLDDDPGIDLEGASSVVTGEWGSTATFQIKLNRQPTATVHVPLATSNAAEGKVAPAELVFSTTDWNVLQTVTVTGVDDAVVDGTQAFMIAVGPLTSADPVYSGLDPVDVVAHNRDDDVKAQIPKLLGSDHVCTINNRQVIATDAFGTIYVAVTCDVGILVFASADGGTTFSEPVTLPNTDTVGDVRIAGGLGGVAYVAYESPNVGALVTATHDGGATWSAATTLFAGSNTGVQIGQIRLGAAGDVVFAALTSSGNGPSSFLWKSTNGGRTFGARTIVEAFNMDLFVRPDGKTVWLATDGTLRKSTDGGAHFAIVGAPGIDTTFAEIDDTRLYALQFSQLMIFDLASFVGATDGGAGGGGGGADGSAGTFDGGGSSQAIFLNLPQQLDIDVTPSGDAILMGDVDTGKLGLAHWVNGTSDIPDPKSFAPHADAAGLVILSPKLVATAFASGNLILFATTAPP